MGCSSLSSMRTRPDLASTVKLICILHLRLKRVQRAGSKVLAHLYKKYRVSSRKKLILCKGFDAKYEALISQMHRILTDAKVLRKYEISKYNNA